MWQHLFGKDIARRRALRRVASGPLHDFLSVPFPSRTLRCKDVEIVALDLETTGLNPAKDRILSVGMVHIQGMAVQLESAWQQVIRISHPIPEPSAIIHRITDDQSARGLPLQQVLPEVLKRLAGNVMLVHHAALEQQFLDHACRSLYGSAFLIPLIDTERLAKRRFERRNRPFRPGELRLFNLRERYGLPRYTAHSALSDALGTAELFLAIAAGMSADCNCRLRDVLS
jgi:DNA polymerase-3 subunit epsilon